MVNRGQRDIDSRKSIDKALDAEKKFFEGHPVYSSRASYFGTPFLARKLNLVSLMKFDSRIDFNECNCRRFLCIIFATLFLNCEPK